MGWLVSIVVGVLTAVVTMLKQLGMSTEDFVVFRQRVHHRLEPAVLALLILALLSVIVQFVSPYDPLRQVLPCMTVLMARKLPKPSDR